jgi:hypothetical protein
MRLFLLSVFSLLMFSCVPVSIAPRIKTHKLVKAKRFKRDLPKNYGFIFKDPKKVDEFFQFVTAKYDLGVYDFDNPAQISFSVDGKEYYIAIYEREKATTTVNLVPLATDLSLEANDLDPVFESAYTSRKGHWYLILLVTNDDGEDALNPSYKERQKVIDYLVDLKKEYLTTQDYVRAYLKGNH